MHSKWEVYAEEITDDDVYKKCEKDYNDSEVIVTRQIKAAEAFLKEAPSDTGTTQPNAAGGNNVKIDELLKPKELLLLSMTLEEADEWFTNFRAFLKHNERALAKQDISVSRALLNKSIEAKLSSSPRADTTVQATTPIAEPGGYLGEVESYIFGKEPTLVKASLLLQMSATKR